MNTEMTQVTAEISYLLDTLNNATKLIDDADLERIQRALMLSQSRLMAMEIERPSTIRDCGISIAYH